MNYFATYDKLRLGGLDPTLTKLKAPLFGLSAIGRLAKSIAFRHSRGHNIVGKSALTPDAKSLAQLSWRHMYLKAVALWHALSPAEKQDWESLARRRHMTGFAWFMSQALKPNPGLYLPLQGGTMAGDIDMAKYRLLKLPLPTNNQEAASKIYVDTSIPPGGYTEGARVKNTANQTIPTATDVFVPFNAEDFDTDVIHDNAVNNSRLTCKTAGKYLIGAHFYFDNGLGAGLRRAIIMLNGITNTCITETPAGAMNIGHFIGTTYNMSINDYVELKVLHTDGGNLILYCSSSHHTRFWMQRIG